jgi:polysaccharide deacetylase family protein (PEP-CTERM system associated)
MITQQSQSEFEADLQRSLRVLRAQSGQPVVGYRAPSFSIVRQTLWALDVLLEQGIEYDASIFPVHHDRYGIPGAPRAPYRVARRGPQELWELPPATLRLGGRTLPAAGGGYLRLLPYAWAARAVRQLNDAGMPAVVYTHPWEYDVEQPRVALPRLQALRHYGRLATTRGKLARLLRDFEFGTCRDVYSTARHGAVATAALAVADERHEADRVQAGELA